MKRLILLILSFSIVVSVVTIVFFSNWLVIQEINISSRYLSKDEVLTLSQVEAGKSILAVNPESIRNNLLKDPRIEAASVEKSYPHSLFIEVVERLPFAKVLTEEKVLILDETGRVIEENTDHPDLPLVSGFPISHTALGEHITTKDAEIFRQCLNLVQLLSQTPLKGVMIEYQEHQILLMPTEKLIVRFGRAEDIEKQFTNFMALYEKLLEEDNLQGVIDVTNSDVANYRPFE